jgi:hypothetical protein
LFLGPHALGFSNSSGNIPEEGDSPVWEFHEQMKDVVKEKHAEVLGLWNLTVQAWSSEGLDYRQKVALVEAMMVINWLSKLENS